MFYLKSTDDFRRRLKIRSLLSAAIRHFLSGDASAAMSIPEDEALAARQEAGVEQYLQHSDALMARPN